MEFSVEFFKLDNFANEEISISVSNLRISNVYHVAINIEIQLRKKL